MKTYSGLDLRSFVNIKPRSVFLVIPVIESEEEFVSRTLMFSRNRKAILDYPKNSRVCVLFLDDENQDVYLHTVECIKGVYRIDNILRNKYRQVITNDHEGLEITHSLHGINFPSTIAVNKRSYAIIDKSDLYLHFGNGGNISETHLGIREITVKEGQWDLSYQIINECLYGKNVSKTEIIDYVKDVGNKYDSLLIELDSLSLSFSNNSVNLNKIISKENVSYEGFSLCLSEKTIGLMPMFLLGVFEAEDKKELFTFLNDHYLR